MGDIKTLADQIYRDYETDGVPSSGAHEPEKALIRQWADLIDGGIGPILLKSNLGYFQLYNPGLGEFYTYSQNGDFAAAVRDGERITAFGPNPKFPAVSQGRRVIDDDGDYDYAAAIFGQSNAVGGDASAGTADSGSAAYYTKLAPMDDRVFMFKGGTFPNQYGPGSVSSDKIITLAQYSTIVPLVEGTNDGRVNGPFTRETIGTSMAITIGRALQRTSTLLMGAFASGSTSAADNIGQYLKLSVASWVGNVATMDTIGTSNLQAGDKAWLSSFAPSGWNGKFTVLSNTYLGGNLSRLTMTMADPGGAAPSTLGQVSNPSVQFRNAMTSFGYWADNIARPGKARLLVALRCGHEADTQAGYVQGPIQRGYFLERMDELAERINALYPTPRAVVIPITHYGRIDHHDLAVRSGHTSMSQAIERADYARSGGNDTFQTFADYPTKANNDVLINTPHFDPDAQHRRGSKAGQLVIDILNEETIAAPQPNNDFTMVLNAPTVITGSLPYAFVEVTTEVKDPAVNQPGHKGKKGIQVFTTASLRTDEAYVESQLSSVTCADTTMTVQTATPPGSKRVIVTGAYFTNKVIKPLGNAGIIAFSWDGTYLQLQFERDHNSTVGGEIAIVEVVNTGAAVPVRNTVSAIVNSTTLKFPMASDPGTWTPGTGRQADLGQMGNGRAFGNRTIFRKAEGAIPRHTDDQDGAPLYDYMLPFHFNVNVRSSKLGQEDMLTEIEGVDGAAIKARFPTRYDHADAACCPDNATTTVTNQGSRGSSENMTKSALTLTGTPGSKSRNTNLVATGDVGQMVGVTTPVTWADAHKAGKMFCGVLAGTFVTGAQNQYLGCTVPGEGTITAGGVYARINTSGQFQAGVSNGTGSVYSKTTTLAAIASGSPYVIGFCIADGGLGFIWINGTVEVFNSVYVSPSSSSAQQTFRVGTSGGSANRRLATGFKLNLEAYGDGVTADAFEYTEIEAYLRSVYYRTLNDA